MGSSFIIIKIDLHKFQLFADMERKRQHLETRDMEERKRKREAEIEQEEQMSFEKEWAKNFEVSILSIKVSQKISYVLLVKLHLESNINPNC